MKRALGFLIIGLLLAFSLPSSAVAQETVYFPTTEWRTSTPEAQGLDSAQLAQFLNRMSALPDAFHSIVLIRHGYVVLDTSMYPFDASRPQAFRDTSDAVMATLVGIAIDQGYLHSVDQSIWDFLPKDQTANMDENKAALTIEDFLTHRSGLQYIEGQDFENYYPLTDPDQSWVQTFIDGKMARRPGTVMNWFYGDGLVLSAILQQATGMSTFDFAQQHLFGPLGISDVTWLADPQGITIGNDELYLSPQDMAKFAYLYLHNGQWQGQQIISERWVQAATSELVPLSPSTGVDAYGYGWLVAGTGRNRFFSQSSPGGEQFAVFPELDLIYLVTGDTYYTLLFGFPDNLLTSVSDSATLPENPEAVAALNAEVASFASPAPHDLTAPPEIASAVSGKTFTLNENPTGWQSLAIDFGAPGSNHATLTLGINDSTVSLTTGLDMVNRVTPVGLPAQPGSGSYRLYGDLPWMAEANWRGKGLNVWMGDLMGREIWQVALSFPDENRVSVQATLHGLEWRPSIWGFSGSAE